MYVMIYADNLVTDGSTSYFAQAYILQLVLIGIYIVLKLLEMLSVSTSLWLNAGRTSQDNGSSKHAIGRDVMTVTYRPHASRYVSDWLSSY